MDHNPEVNRDYAIAYNSSQACSATKWHNYVVSYILLVTGHVSIIRKKKLCAVLSNNLCRRVLSATKL